MNRAWLFVAAAALFSPAQTANPRRQIQALIETGKLDEAERTARAGGARLSATLGEVLVLRGRLASADSAFRAAIASGSPERWIAEVNLGELAARRGDTKEAFSRADAVAAAYERSPKPWSSDDATAAARAYLVLGTQAKWVRSALSAFDAAVARDSSNIDAMVRIGDLFLDKFNAPDARTAYDLVLAHSSTNARALLGLTRVLDFQDSANSHQWLLRAMANNPNLTGGHVWIARSYLESEAYDSARAAAHRALAVDSSSSAAWAILGATAWITGDSAGYRAALAAAQKLNPRPAEFFAELADAAVRSRRYAEANALAEQAVAYDSGYVRALGILGTNRMRTGDMARARLALERAFALDPYNIWHKNTLDLLDALDKFKTVTRGRFTFVTPAPEAELLTTYLSPLLEQAYDSLAKRYDYRPPTPVRIEIYGNHADFSVRTVGLAGLGALGVSFGTTLAMDSPSARDPAEFNWGSTAWHELTHTFTLGRSKHRVPRWLSEGLSVFEEHRARPGWGADVTAEFLAAFKGGKVRRLSELNEGFTEPRYPMELQYSYIEASLVCEMIASQRGMPAIVALLAAYADGLDTPAAFQRVLGAPIQTLDGQFDAWLKQRYAQPLRYIDANQGPPPPTGLFVTTTVEGAKFFQANQFDSARAVLTRASSMFPNYSGLKGPAWYLALLDRQDGNIQVAIDELTKITTQNETAAEANVLEADLRLQLRDSVGALAALDRVIWMSPFDVSLHNRLADLAVGTRRFPIAVRERRAVMAL
ncbi:MAG TPA: tetratricopeptide repeat protein, partial [Gemmatimonadaceae bacterium]|nr:tetratricopeptide repeat protein [Gemmatimonadaceae bacterium]